MRNFINRRPRVTAAVALFFVATIFFASCGDDDDAVPTIAGANGVQVQIMSTGQTGPGLELAINDLEFSFGYITGTLRFELDGTRSASERTSRPLNSTPAAYVIIDVDPSLGAAYGEQGFSITSAYYEFKHALYVNARTQVGAMYALYKLQADLGVRYIHPEETYWPTDPQARLPWGYDGTIDTPDFDLRGFHEHTQHPIPASDFFLKAGRDDYRLYASNYLKWLARNRQNAMSFHFLKTVDQTTWLPYIADIAEQGRGYGIKVGMITGFADQQQNAFKLIGDLEQPHEPQIEASLNRLMAGGFDFIGLQFGASEFTSQPDDVTLGWINHATDYMRRNYPATKLYGWIHIFCGHEAEGGGYFFHLPLQSDPDFGAFVHTTMYYTLEHPAPVYQCEDFTHQIDFMEQANGRREQVFFPETAWWLGFDNNLPFGHPLTGWSRAYDIREVLPRFDVTGHINFTTGKEWGYWQYDNYLCQVTWDTDLTWEAYLDWLSPVFGPKGEIVAEVLRDWTMLQKRHFYEENPQMYFYLSGERPEDEAEVAHPVKPFFREVADWNQADFDRWYQGEFMMLKRMRDEYANLFSRLPAESDAPQQQQAVLYEENRLALEMTIHRIDQAIELFEGAMDCREWRQESITARAEGRAPDESIKNRVMPIAEEHLRKAEELTAMVLEKIANAGRWYRYPPEMLYEEKPDSLTAYPIGYLTETHNGYYWKRRNDELRLLMERVFSGGSEEWTVAPEAVYYSESTDVFVLEPNNPFATVVLQGFLPTFLYGLEGYNASTGTMTMHFAQDYNENGKPDVDTEVVFTGTVSGNLWTGTGDDFEVVVRDSSGNQVGTLGLFNLAIELEVNGASPITTATMARIAGKAKTDNLVDIVVNGIGGYDEDGLRGLLKSIWGVPANEPLPDELPMTLQLTLHTQ